MHVWNNIFSIMDKVLRLGIVKYLVKNCDITTPCNSGQFCLSFGPLLNVNFKFEVKFEV